MGIYNKVKNTANGRVKMYVLIKMDMKLAYYDHKTNISLK